MTRLRSVRGRRRAACAGRLKGARPLPCRSAPGLIIPPQQAKSKGPERILCYASHTSSAAYGPSGLAARQRAWPAHESCGRIPQGQGDLRSSPRRRKLWETSTLEWVESLESQIDLLLPEESGPEASRRRHCGRAAIHGRNCRGCKHDGCDFEKAWPLLAAGRISDPAGEGKSFIAIGERLLKFTASVESNTRNLNNGGATAIDLGPLTRCRATPGKRTESHPDGVAHDYSRAGRKAHAAATTRRRASATMTLPARQKLFERTQAPKELPVEGWDHLVARRHPWRKQLFVAGRNLTVRQLTGTVRANGWSDEEAAEALDLPAAAVREAMALRRRESGTAGSRSGVRAPVPGTPGGTEVTLALYLDDCTIPNPSADFSSRPGTR